MRIIVIQQDGLYDLDARRMTIQADQADVIRGLANRSSDFFRSLVFFEKQGLVLGSMQQKLASSGQQVSSRVQNRGLLAISAIPCPHLPVLHRSFTWFEVRWSQRRRRSESAPDLREAFSMRARPGTNRLGESRFASMTKALGWIAATAFVINLLITS